MNPFNRSVGGNHYEESAIQPIEFILANKLNWCEANAVKYICRHRVKNGRQDIEKAIHYLELLLESEYTDSPEETDAPDATLTEYQLVFSSPGIELDPELLRPRYEDRGCVSVPTPENPRPFEGFFWGVPEDLDESLRRTLRGATST